MTRLVLRFLLAVASPMVLPLLPTAYAQPAPPDKPKVKQAKSYVDAGLAAQGGGDYDTAITFYSKAYELVPHPVLLFNIAQAHRLAGRQDQAVKFYQSFLATNPTGAEAQIARDLLAEIAKRKAEQARRIEQATKARKNGRFEDARVELEAAYALDPQPDLLYALGQVHTKLGNCGEASTYYKRFVATQKDPRVTDVVDQAIAACKSAPNPVRERPQPPDSPRPPSGERTPSPDSLPQPPDRPSEPTADKQAPTPDVARHGSPWYKDKLGDSLVLGGVTATAVALVEYGSALSDLSTARGAPSLSRYHALVDLAHSKRTVSVVLVGAGSALIVTGVIRYVLHGETTDVGTIGVAPARGSGVVTYERRF
jgi:tetratricopeptide (TPR) repeat protein